MTEIIEAKWSPDMDLTSIFSELGDNCSISIERKEPEWCNGHIRTVHFNPDEPISLDWVQKKFGGEKLQVRLYGPRTAQHKSGYLGARTVDIMGPPRDGHGIEMTQGPDGKAVKVTELMGAIERHNQKMGVMQKQEAAALQPPAPSPLQSETLVQTLITTQGQQNQVMMEMMSSRVKGLEEMLYRQPVASGGPPTNPIDQIKQTAEAMALLKNMSGDFGDSGNNDDDSILSMIGPIIQGMFAAKNNPKPVPQGVLKSPTPARVIQGPQKNETRSLETLTNNLSNLSAEDAAQVVFHAMGRMPEDKRDSAMKSFMTRGSDMESGLDESLNEVDTNSQDADEFTDPFADTQGDPVPGQGWEPGENETNDQVGGPGNQTGS